MSATAATGRFGIGIDVGGTDVKVAMVHLDHGTISAACEFPVGTDRAPAEVLGRVAAAVEALDPSLLAADVGVALPGNVDRSTGTARYVPALGPDWTGVHVADELTRRWSDDRTLVPCVVNDVQAMTLAEWRLGAAAGVDDALCIAIGTGVGGGVVIGGRRHLGVDDTAGAIGHMTVEPDGRTCVCGNLGCLEPYANAAAIVAAAGAHDARSAAAAAARGDPAARAAFAEAGRYLGIAVANVCAMVTPKRVVVGGGIATAGDLLLEPLRAELASRARVASIRDTHVVLAALGRMSGAIGAALEPSEILSTVQPVGRA